MWVRGMDTDWHMCVWLADVRTQIGVRFGCLCGLEVFAWA